MPPPDPPLPLEFTHEWVSLGITSVADIHCDEQEALSGDDPFPEHYRWRAFSRFLAAQHQLAASLAHALYALGTTDADPSMGGSMMAAVLRRPDCPGDLLQSATLSPHAHLRRIAAKRLASPE